MAMNTKSPGRVLVTGGAGYIGSHTALAMVAEGWDVVIADDLSTGNRRLVPPESTLHVGNVGDRAFLEPIFKATPFDAVIHFAGSISVPESVSNPLKYYRNNFNVSCELVQMCVDAGVERFIFSSTAAVYGMPQTIPVTEAAPKEPINPYGHSKRMTELMLNDVAAATSLRYVALRYFNVAGGDAAGRAGHMGTNSTNLIKAVAELATGRRANLTVFGADYDTTDGTGVRDFIHVTDLADAHMAALRYLMNGGESEIMNCGYGRGFTVKQVLAAAEKIVGRALAYQIGPRRAGDPAAVIAETSRIRRALEWTPRHADLDLILRSAINWEAAL